MVHAILLALAAWTGASQTYAQTGSTTTTKGNGLSLTVITQWLDGGGYRPIRIEIAPLAAPVADRTVHVEFTGKSWAFRSREILASQDIEVPAGSTSVEATVAVPQHFQWQQFHLEVWIDGRYSKALSQKNVGMGGGWNGWQEGLPNVLSVADVSTAVGGTVAPAGILAADPGSAELAKLLPENANVQSGFRTGVTIAPPATTTAGTVPLYTMISVPLDLLPQRWIDYSSLDIICITLGQIEQLAAKYPQRWQAIRDWTEAGGNLIVSGVGGSFENLAALDRQLDEPSAKSQGSQAGQSAGKTGAPREWLKPSPPDYGNTLKDLGQTNYAVTTAAPGIPAGSPMPSGSPMPAGTVNLSSIPDPAPFRLRPGGLGMVVAASTDDVFKQPSEHWAWMLNSLTPDRWLWYRRHGLSAERSNPGFWSWLIEGVGLAPVSEFRILISIFVLAIGPLNYYWLRRRGKLHLLVLIVPLAALAVTGSLFGYALIADGLDVRVRSRSFTQIDQRAGHAVCWARNSYYAGLAPSALHFPADVAVLPLLLNEGDTSDAAHRHTLLWTDDEQRLVSGWIASRTPTQFITVRSRASQAGVQFGRTDRGPQIENHLDSRIIRLLLADEKGQHYRAAGVAAGARVALEAVEPGGEELEIWQYVTDHRPGVPQGYMPHMDQGFGGIRRRGAWYYNQSNMGLPAPMQETSRLEAALRTAVMGSGGRSISLKPAEFALRPRSYLAVVERSPEVVFGVEDPREENSLHMIVGNW